MAGWLNWDHLMWATVPLYTASRSGNFPKEAGPLNASIPDTFMIVPSPLATIRGTAARVSIVGATTVAEVCAAGDLAMLNNAGVAHYMPIAQLPADKADELRHVFAPPTRFT
jgi:hypothetical protein